MLKNVRKSGNDDKREQPSVLRAGGWLRGLRGALHLPALRLRAQEVLGGFDPGFEVSESDEAYVFTVDLPGVKESDLEISVLGKQVLIRGRRHAETSRAAGTCLLQERSFGSFSRAFVLAEEADADRMTAELKDGVLVIAVPKRQPRAAAKKVTVRALHEEKKAQA